MSPGFKLYSKWLLLGCVGLASCQQLQAPFKPKTDTSSISWEGVTIQRDNTPEPTDLDDDIEAEAVELNEPDSTMIPESDLPVITVVPQDLDPQLFLGQSPDELANRLGGP